MHYDVMIIGGGVVGALIARELSRYSCKVVVREKESDVAAGTTKANSGIVHAGFDALPGSQKAKFNVLGSKLMEQTCADLNVHYKRNGAMVLAFGPDDEKVIRELFDQGIANGVEGLSILSGDAARQREPLLSTEVTAALLAETSAVVCPYTLAVHAMQNAMQNGVELSLSDHGGHDCDYIINAAGIHADEAAAMAGDHSIHITPRRGEYMLFDKDMGRMVSHTIFQPPHKKLGKGVLITPTADGNLLVGPNAMNLQSHEKDLDGTTQDGQDEIIAKARKSVPSLSVNGRITSFAGLRAIADTDDFIIGWSETVPRLFHAAGMQSPGLSASPAIAAYVAEQIAKDAGFALNPNFDPVLPIIKKQSPAYGNIICRCETVSEGEIIDCIRGDCGARDIDGVKRRTRAGMGRCQGGFCMPRVMDILTKELGKSPDEITKKSDASTIINGHWPEGNVCS